MTDIRTDAKPRHILLVVFDTPYPADYGGVYDVMARTRYFKKLGYIIDVLCCYRDPRRMEAMKRQLLEEGGLVFRTVHALKTRLHLPSLLRGAPLSAAIRNIPIPDAMAEQLARTSYEFVHFEHLKLYLWAQRLSSLIRADFRLRTHNDEPEYYRTMSRRSRPGISKLFLFLESCLYRRFQRIALGSTLFSTVYFISTAEAKSLSPLVRGIPRYLPIYFDDGAANRALEAERSRSAHPRSIDFLYVGNLNLNDNLEAVLCALRFLRAKLKNSGRIVVCGRCESPGRQTEIAGKVSSVIRCEVHFNASREKLASLYADSRFFLNFSTNSGGVKTKLVEALTHGLLVISDSNGLFGSGLDACCVKAESVTTETLQNLLNNPADYEVQRSTLIGHFKEAARVTARAHAAAFGEPP